jgi:hypothetical protein
VTPVQDVAKERNLKSAELSINKQDREDVFGMGVVKQLVAVHPF